MKEHSYKVTIKWTGNRGTGTSDYRSYERSHIISGEHKGDISGSSDIAFRGDSSGYNPEELLVASVSGCHMLWFLHECAVNGVIVTGYTDNPVGIMVENQGAGGRFTEVVLHPHVTVADKIMLEKLALLHENAHAKCFIANSLNFPVKHNPTADFKR